MSFNPKILSLHGRGLKFNTREDIASELKDVDPAIVEEIHLGGNTIGVEASKELAEFLKKTKVLKVRGARLRSHSPPSSTCLSDRRLCGYLYWPVDRRNSSGASADMQRADGQDITSRIKSQRQRVR